jgi:HAD superfamily hydrolase (TIGR01509 family)
MKLKLGIASSAQKRLIDYILEKFEIKQLFDSVISADDITHGKPNPEILPVCARKLKVNPAECLVVEDSRLGVQAAKTAGMKCLGYRNPDNGKQDLSKADLITDDLSKLDIQKLLL